MVNKTQTILFIFDDHTVLMRDINQLDVCIVDASTSSSSSTCDLENKVIPAPVSQSVTVDGATRSRQSTNTSIVPMEQESIPMNHCLKKNTENCIQVCGWCGVDLDDYNDWTKCLCSKCQKSANERYIMKQFNLSEKRMTWSADNQTIVFLEKDVKEFIRLLKKEFKYCYAFINETVNKLAGRILTLKEIKDNKCSICGDLMDEENWDNNAEPINNGRCCEHCNMCIVLPARLRKIKEMRDG